MTDPVDAAVNVTISDPNATRDGVPTPAFHFEATLNTTTSNFNSYRAGIGYAFPAALAYGGGWTVNFSAPNGGSVKQNVTTLVYYTHLQTSVGNGATLPGEPLSVFWSLLSEANDATIYTHATGVWITGQYSGNGTVQNFFAQGRVALMPASAGRGQWNGTVPANATPDSLIQFHVYAVTNLSGAVAENESGLVNVDIGVLSINGVGITPSPPTCSLFNDYYFVTGSLISSCIEVGANYFGSFTPISGLPVTVGYWNGTAHVHPVGAPTSLTTNALGEAAFTFNGSSPPFIPYFHYPGYDALNFTTHVPGASTHYQWYDWVNETWALEGYSSASGVVAVSLDHTQYYAGTVATVTWSISTTDEAVTGPITATGWEVSGPNAIVYQIGALAGTALTGTFTFPVTEAMVPNTIDVTVFAANATDPFLGYASAVVDSPSLLLTPGSYYYGAGTTASVTVVLNGGGAGAQIQYQVTGYWSESNGLMASGTVANGSSIQIGVPSSTPPQYIEIYAWATVQGQVLATNSVELRLDQGYSILLGVTTTSSYSDGSYQPGQTIQLSYQVVSVNGAALPQVVSFELLAIGYPNEYSIQNVGTSGTLSFTIPSNAVQGTLILELQAQGALSAGPCLGGCIGVASLSINPSPSVLSLELGAGSGVTVGWLILLVLVIVVGVALFFLMRRGGRFPPAKPTMNPPAPAPSTEPPAEWTPPPPSPAAPEASADDSPPGLPEPPAPPA
ncbi:MAG TPA: hypothetical protein VJ021_00845 [Thermoplasmata archaeon]|nr:hypothetical protein [Thermoplasmata archaeon]